MELAVVSFLALYETQVQDGCVARCPAWPLNDAPEVPQPRKLQQYIIPTQSGI